MTLSSSRTLDFSVCKGSVTGREHRRLYRNNQDAVAIHQSEDRIIAIVADGCSSGASSEVGANLASRWLVEWIPQFHSQLRESMGASDFAETIASALTEYLLRTAGELVAPSKEEEELSILHRIVHVVSDYLLFTFHVLIMDADQTWIFGIGDGLVSVNGKKIIIDAGPRNAPDYIGYRLVPQELIGGRECPPPSIHFAGPTSEIENLVLATDGAIDILESPFAQSESCPLRALEMDDSLFVNPSLFQKRLRALDNALSPLNDDTTLVLVRRRI